MRAWTLVVLAFALAVPAGAQQQRSPFEGDARLKKPVSVQWRKATLFDALQELSRATGVKLTPDRPLIDEPVMASSHDMPAGALLEHVARLLHFTWVRSGGTAEAPNYLLYQTRSAREEEEAQIEGSRREVMQALQEELAKYRRLGRLSPEEAERELRRSDEQLTKAFQGGGIAELSSNPGAARQLQDSMAVRAAASPTGKALLSLIEGMTPQHWEQVQDEQPVIFSSQPRHGELPMPAAVLERLRSAPPQFPLPREVLRGFGGAQIDEGIDKLEAALREQWDKAEAFKITIQLNLSMGSQPVGVLRVTPEATGGDAASVGPMSMISGLTMMAAPALLTPPMEDPEERAKRLGADPLLGKKAVLKLPELKPQRGLLAALGGAYRTADVLPAIEAAFGVKIISDAYNRQAMSLVPPLTGERALFEVLDRVAGMTRNWERDGNVIRLRSRTWAHDRRAEIPARYTRRWLAVKASRGGALSLDDLAEIAITLRDAQVDSLFFSVLEEDAADFTEFLTVPMNRDILRFYGRLLPLQRQTLQAGRPLAAQALYPFQQVLLLNLNSPKGGSMFALGVGSKPRRRPEEMAGAVVTLQRTGVDGQAGAAPPAGAAAGGGGAIYTFRVTYPSGEKDEHQIALMRAAVATATSTAVPDGPAPPEPPVPVEP